MNGQDPVRGRGTFHPAINQSSGAFTLSHRLEDGRQTVKITVPRKRVAAVLKLLARFYPDQQDLQIHPVPLRSIFRISRETELDLAGEAGHPSAPNNPGKKNSWTVTT